MCVRETERDGMTIRTAKLSDYPGMAALWNLCVDRGEVLYARVTPEKLRELFMRGEGRREAFCLVCAEGGEVLGLIQGVPPMSFQLARPGYAYLTTLLVDPRYRGRGVGTSLLQRLTDAARGEGGEHLMISSLNPVQITWTIPGTPGHDHNNMPGLDTDCAGAGFFRRRGFEERHREVSMYLDLSGYVFPEKVEEIRKRLRAEGIEAGVHDPTVPCEFDEMCTRVDSDYWRSVLRTELEAWKRHEPNRDERFWPDGRRPKGPRTLLTAVKDGHMVGFTGPVDMQESGRGWFTGICTDPLYERRGIATVLFNLLMRAFVEEGARFSSLFTGVENHAQKIYRTAGFEPRRCFAIMDRKI